MKIDRLDQSYKILKQSCGLMAITLVAVLFKPVFGESIQSIVELFIAIPVLVAGIISIRGFYLAIRGSQYGQRNSKKRYFALFGNLLFATIIVGLLITILADITRTMS